MAIQLANHFRHISTVSDENGIKSNMNAMKWTRTLPQFSQPSDHTITNQQFNEQDAI